MKAKCKGSGAKMLAEARRVRQVVIDLLNEHDALSVADICEVVKLKPQQMRQKLARMMAEGDVRSDLIPGTHSPFIAMYSLGLADDSSKDVRQRTVHKYPLHHVRDSLVAALFGAPTKGNDHA